MIVGDEEWGKVIVEGAYVRLIQALTLGWKSIAGYLGFSFTSIASIDAEHHGMLGDQATAFLHECAKRAVDYEKFLAALEGTDHQAIANYLRSLFSARSQTSSSISSSTTSQQPQQQQELLCSLSDLEMTHPERYAIIVAQLQTGHADWKSVRAKFIQEKTLTTEKAKGMVSSADLCRWMSDSGVTLAKLLSVLVSIQRIDIADLLNQWMKS
eukprot:TRINITY_DN12984_c0_g1_i1.p1 TRINITY_DN12984_c0_g1~~TRINITY_DN12984_c0_g1_i1.p1  ORF type:complete len:212 (+),score=35.07 TRINITY_DN12984_c0_g1_i1:122-757(+)